ncbi:uncharacterized protein M421DRAFT_381972 [Didymella exigua CBS 183.55]|uniref:Uncharacterized protein n=1 Tax=Didymella exigua CBS 183.55 TaxID=1150837 RepID=A0A6A5RUJ7_9PLEO|nr:uncharacterized protein M421DRAFT_381972 [Didymella exigua CBS 183.55]KAF1929976.1 hypothetical protein M421DRAFT_381972 [Didymella exigua CBS 183.55]
MEASMRRGVRACGRYLRKSMRGMRRTRRWKPMRKTRLQRPKQSMPKEISLREYQIYNTLSLHGEIGLSNGRGCVGSGQLQSTACQNPHHTIRSTTAPTTTPSPHHRPDKNKADTVQTSKNYDVGRTRTYAPEGNRFQVCRDNHSATTPIMIIATQINTLIY